MAAGVSHFTELSTGFHGREGFTQWHVLWITHGFIVNSDAIDAHVSHRVA